MNPEHPPLFKYLFAFPLLFLDPRLPTDDPSWNEPDPDNAEAHFGGVFLYRNRVPADTLLFWGRVPAIAVTLLFGLRLALWTRRRFSTPAALVALFFFTTDPNLIAHDRYSAAC